MCHLEAKIILVYKICFFHQNLDFYYHFVIEGTRNLHKIDCAKIWRKKNVRYSHWKSITVISAKDILVCSGKKRYLTIIYHLPMLFYSMRSIFKLGKMCDSRSVVFNIPSVVTL